MGALILLIVLGILTALVGPHPPQVGITYYSEQITPPTGCTESVLSYGWANVINLLFPNKTAIVGGVYYVEYYFACPSAIGFTGTEFGYPQTCPTGYGVNSASNGVSVQYPVILYIGNSTVRGFYPTTWWYYLKQLPGYPPITTWPPWLYGQPNYVPCFEINYVPPNSPNTEYMWYYYPVATSVYIGEEPYVLNATGPNSLVAVSIPVVPTTVITNVTVQPKNQTAVVNSYAVVSINESDGYIPATLIFQGQPYCMYIPRIGLTSSLTGNQSGFVYVADFVSNFTIVFMKPSIPTTPVSPSPSPSPSPFPSPSPSPTTKQETALTWLLVLIIIIIVVPVIGIALIRRGRSTTTVSIAIALLLAILLVVIASHASPGMDYSGFTVSPTFVVLNATPLLTMEGYVNLQLNVTVLNPYTTGSIVGTLKCGSTSVNFVVQNGVGSIMIALKPSNIPVIVGLLNCTVSLPGYPSATVWVDLVPNASYAYATVSPISIVAMPPEEVMFKVYGTLPISAVYYGGVLNRSSVVRSMAVCGGVTMGYALINGFEVPFTVSTPGNRVIGVSVTPIYAKTNQTITVPINIVTAGSVIGIPINYMVTYPSGSVSGYASVPPGYTTYTLYVPIPGQNSTFTGSIIVNGIKTNYTVYITPQSSTTSWLSG